MEGNVRSVMVTQICDYTKNQSTVHFKRMKRMIWELHLHKAVFKKEHVSETFNSFKNTYGEKITVTKDMFRVTAN